MGWGVRRDAARPAVSARDKAAASLAAPDHREADEGGKQAGVPDPRERALDRGEEVGRGRDVGDVLRVALLVGLGVVDERGVDEGAAGGEGEMRVLQRRGAEEVSRLVGELRGVREAELAGGVGPQYCQRS